ncbi:MAG: cysteine desulfurase [Ignavibacteriales bacterium]|nr:MAG: cysteine desulfurase [Ignavibacteriales bacterium]
MIKFPIYLDNQATTPVDPEVFETMKPYYMDKFGNASSKSHSFGWEADSAVENSRKKIASLFNADPKQVVFTSGATESINLVHQGVASTYRNKGKHIITCATEHTAVLQSLEYLEKHGFEIQVLRSEGNGKVNPELIKKNIREDTILVSVMTVNNEIGTINDIEKISEICTERNVIFHTDATQAIGKLKFSEMKNLPDLISFTAHKIYGPKGIGALVFGNAHKRIRLKPLVYGGGQEMNIRPGTLNVPAIAGFGKAVELAINNFDEENKRIKNLQQKLFNGLKKNISNIELNGDINDRIPNNLNIIFNDVKANDILLSIREIAVSTGSACASGEAKKSHVLSALGLSSDKISSSVRFGIGRFNTEEEIDFVIEKLTETINRLKSKNNFISTEERTLTK